MRRFVAVVSSVLLFGAVGAGLAGPAHAETAAAPARAAAATYRLSANYSKYDSVLTGLNRVLPNVHVHDVMEAGNHDRRGLGSGTPSTVQGGFRFDSGDSGDCRNVPQGITTSRDSVGTANSGNYDGHQIVVVSWYTKTSCDSGAGTRSSRLTLVDWDATYPNTYRKVLLVEPTGSSASPNYRDVPVHAGGIAWFGNYLYVADTNNGLRAFDMREILKVSTAGSDSDIGRQGDGTYRAHNYAYVLPQVGTISDTSTGTPLSWSTISLDRVSRSLVMSEYTCSGCTSYPDRAPRALRFPFAAGGGTFASTTYASEVLTLPWRYVNGVASHNGRWWWNDSHHHHLIYWQPGAANSLVYPWVSSGESISYWEDTANPDLLWSLQESGDRNVFAVNQASYDG